MYRNPEYYPDPTVGRALEDLRRKETRLNTGKQFEADWKSSMPKDAWCYRGKVNRTFAISASAVLEYMNTQTRKSIPWQWAALNGIEVEQRLLRVHWRYDVEGLLKRLEGGEAV